MILLIKLVRETQRLTCRCMLYPSPLLRSFPPVALFLYAAALKTKKTAGSPIPSVGAVARAVSPAYSTPQSPPPPTMPSALPHPGLEHEGDKRINKVSFDIAFCVNTLTKQSKLHSPQECTFLLPPSPPSRQYPSQVPSIPPSTSSSTKLLTSPSNTDAYTQPPSPLPPPPMPSPLDRPV